MTEELRPPPEYAHLEYHWVKRHINGCLWIATWLPKTMEWIHVGIQNPVSPAQAGYYFTYHAPCILLVADDATVARIARIIPELLEFSDDENDMATCIITELLRVEPPK
jgi:hypothetical protein